MAEIPILLVYFNRPAVLRQSIRALSPIRPSVLYVAGDGPRTERAGDSTLIAECRTVIDHEIDWPCHVHKLQSDVNFGCDIWVPRAISWFFEHVEYGIILEDDCVISSSFYEFAGEALSHFGELGDVMSISAANFQTQPWGTGDYYFSRYPLCWGWATWRRAWSQFDPTLSELDILLDGGLGHFASSSAEQRFWKRFFIGLRNGRYSFWDAKWVYSVWRANGLVIAPNQNLVSNVGFGEDATHTKTNSAGMAATIGSFSAPLRHPSVDIGVVSAADRYWFKTRTQPKLFGRVQAVAARIVKHLKRNK